MNTMIVSLLDLSALEAGAAKLSDECFDFIELVETVAGRLLVDTPNINHYITYDLPDEKVFMNADKTRMEQVLNNLIENAKKHAADGGEIHLSVGSQENFVRFSIYNQGRQIPLLDISKIWEKFYRGEAPQNSSGSGLGLAIAASILSMYGAEYGVENQSNGPLFYFVFPIKA